MRSTSMIAAPFGLALLLCAVTVSAQENSGAAGRVERSIIEGDIIELSVLEETLPPPSNSVVEGEIKTPQTSQSIASAMLKESNEYRVSVGRSPQKLSTKLTNAAQKRAEQLARTGLITASPLEKSGIRENVAVGQESVQDVFHAWRNSNTHWAKIAANNSSAGFGTAVGHNGSTYWVALYGPADNANPVTKATFEQPVAKPKPKPVAQPTVRKPATPTPQPTARKPAPKPPEEPNRRFFGRRRNDDDGESQRRFGGRNRR